MYWCGHVLLTLDSGRHKRLEGVVWIPSWQVIAIIAGTSAPYRIRYIVIKRKAILEIGLQIYNGPP